MSRKVNLVTYVLIFAASLALLSVNSAYCATVQVSATQDSYIDADFPDLNYGSETALYVESYDAKQRRTLVHFDLPTIPPGAEFTSATLKLYYATFSHARGGNNPGGRIYWAYRVTQPWTESGITWNKYDGTTSWTTAGGDYTETGGASLTMPSSMPRWIQWDVTTIVEAWIDDSQLNYGFIIKDADETMTVENWVWVSFRSREYTNQPGKNPILEIIYTEPGQVTPTIESAIFINPTTWTTTDTFGIGDEVCVVGAGFSPETSYDVMVVNDVDWTDGMTIPSYIAKTTVTTDSGGGVMDAYPVWYGATPGKYDIIVDVNNNGIYDEGIDALDDSDIEVTAGFFVIPEVAIGSIVAVAAMFAALGLFVCKKKHAPKQ